MSAYWIATYDEITDPAKVTAYAEIAFPALQSYGGRYLARGNPAATYELGEDTRTVVIEFDSVEAATTAHDSPEYTEALRVLDGGAQRDLRIVPGV